MSGGDNEYELDRVLEAFEAWNYQVEYLLELLDQTARTVGRGKVDLALAGKQSNRKEQVAVQAAVEQARVRREHLQALLQQATSKATLAEARELHADVRVRLQEARKQFEHWRRLRAVYETALTLDMFAAAALTDTAAVTQAQAEQAVIQAQIEYRTQVSLLLTLLKTCQGFDLA